MRACGYKADVALATCGTRYKGNLVDLAHCAGTHKIDKPTTSLAHCAGGHDHKKKGSTALAHCAGGHDHKKKGTKATNLMELPEDFVPVRFAAAKTFDESMREEIAKEQDDVNFVFMNALSDKYSSCDVAQVGGRDVLTVSSVDDPRLDSLASQHTLCMVYCAHEKCDAAKNFYNAHKEAIDDVCTLGSVYLKGGAKEMLTLDDVQLANNEECAIVLG